MRAFAIAVVGCVGGLAGGLTGCAEGPDELAVEGPPMVRQVRLFEHVVDGTTGALNERRVFAFGEHPLALPAEQHPVTAAVADRIGANSLRVIMDELLVGNELEEIECRGVVDGDTFDRVPRGATPDDVARCAAADDRLAASCAPSSTSICMCRVPGGCVRGGETIAEGQPVGIRDDNLDGGADNLRFIAGAAGIRCGAIDVPIDLESSLWTPSGDQTPPVAGAFDSLGPAIVLTPAGALPTGVRCGLTFAGDVVDKQGNRVCIPEGGLIEAGCTPGDLAAFEFEVEAMAIAPSSFDDGGTVASLTDPAVFTINTKVDDASLANVTVLEAGAPFTGFAVTAPVGLQNLIRIEWLAPGLAAETTYTITFPTTLTDRFAQPLPAAATFTFTTGTGS